MKFVLLLLLSALSLSAQIVTQSVNDTWFAWNGGTNRILTYGFSAYRTDSFAWHIDNTASKTPRVYNASDDVLQSSFTVGSDGDESCQVARAWSIQDHASNIIVAIVDDSFALGHPDLQGRWWINPATGVPGVYVNASGVAGTNANVSDAMIHGTQAAGIIGAIGNNSAGVVGVCKSGVQIMPVATDGSFGGLGFGIGWAATNGANVILFAYGSSSQRTTWTNGVTQAQERGCLLVCATVEGSPTHDVGGEFSSFATRDYPTQWGRNLSTNIIPWMSNIVAVSASIPDGTRYSVSGWSTNFIDILYPGLRIPSCLPPADYATFNGTSPASAIAAGHAALLMERYRSENFMQIKERMMSNTTQRVAYSTNCFSGGNGNFYQSLIWRRPDPSAVRRIRLSLGAGGWDVERTIGLEFPYSWKNYFVSTGREQVELPIYEKPERMFYRVKSLSQ